MKYAWIRQYQDTFRVSRMCQVFEVSRSGYYEWLTRPDSAHRESDRRLAERVKRAFEKGRGSYGTRRIQQELRETGDRVSRQRIGRLLHEQGLRCKTRQKFRATTNSNHALPVAPSHLNRHFQVEQPDRAYVGDITYLATAEGWLYLAVVLDLFSPQVVGWSMAERMTADLVCDALHMACWRRRPGEGLLVHSERGSQYASGAYQALVQQHGFVCSMSRKANCWDNAPAESFFHTLKTELVYHCRFQTREQAKQAIFDYIEVFYNRQRKHSTLGYKTPVEFEQQWQQAA